MKYIYLLMLGVILFSAGCSTPVFNKPMTVSTRSSVHEHFVPIKRVSVIKTDYMIILFPFIGDPRKAYDELLLEAKAVGGDAVIDMRIASAPSFVIVFPPIVATSIEYTGMAVKLKH